MRLSTKNPKRPAWSALPLINLILLRESNMSKFMNAITPWFGLGIVAAFVFGWIINIFKIAFADNIDGMVVLRVIGVFVAPMGGVVGWF